MQSYNCFDLMIGKSTTIDTVLKITVVGRAARLQGC